MNKSFVIQAKTIQELKEKIDKFIESNPNYKVFATPFCWNPHQSQGEEYYIGGYDCILWYEDLTQELDAIPNYESAKLKKIENKNSPATEKQLWALEQANYKWAIPRDKITVLQAIQTLKDLGYKGRRQ